MTGGVRLSLVQPLAVLLLAGLVGEWVRQAVVDPLSLWTELAKQGPLGLLLGLVLWQKRNDDKRFAEDLKAQGQLYQNSLLALLQDASGREDRLLQIVGEDVKAITSIAATLEAFTSATQIVDEIRELRKESQDAATRPRPRSGGA